MVHAMVDFDPLCDLLKGMHILSALAPTLSYYGHRSIYRSPLEDAHLLIYSFTSAVDQSDAFLLGMLISPPNWPQDCSGGAQPGAHDTTACVRLDHVYGVQYIYLDLAPNFQGFEVANGGPLITHSQGAGGKADFGSCCMATLQWEMVLRWSLDGAHHAG
jgi:hypothetical protein